jgi:outer membrane receptor protein involved in Fe transport|tara:strand:+ start:118 stop:3006 length:2889 start_codon:yes stop_codon:yes gene_type:complete
VKKLLQFKLPFASRFSLCIALFFCGLLMQNQSWAQLVSGKVVSEETKASVPYASIKLIGPEYANRRVGVSADENGLFTLAISKFPVTLEITSVGYLPKQINLVKAEQNLIIQLEPGDVVLQEMVFSAEKITEEELRSPIQIEKLTVKELTNTASFNFYDAVVNLKGVDVATQSIVINTVNTRGFNSNTNLRFRQFTDGIDGQAPGLGFSLGNIVGPSGLDIESVELIPGPTTSKYGPGAFNGVLDMRTRNPFDYRGLSFEVKGATLGSDPYDQSFISLGTDFLGEASFRYANAIKNKVGFKVNGSVLSGVDFKAVNYDNIGPGAAFEDTHSISNQSINVVNHYGDDRAALLVVPVRVTPPNMDGLTQVSLRDTAFFVTRKGYREEDLVNYNAQNIKLNGSLHVKLTPKTELVMASFFGKASTMITGDDRIALRDFEIQQHKVEVTNEKFNIRGYTTMQDAGNTYNVGRLAEVMIQTAKPDAAWYNQYRNLYIAGRGNYQTVRNIADSGFPGGSGYESRYKPGTERFDSLRQVVINSIDPRNGARIFDKSRLYHVEASAKLNAWEDFFDSFEVGASARMYDPESRGTIFTDSIGNDVTNFEYGAFAEMSHKIDSRTDATASLRVDKNENFNIITSQRISAVREIKPNTFVRGSLQRGQRLPNIREQFFNQNLGDLTIVGGLPEVVDQYDLQNNAFLESALNKYNQAIGSEINRILAQPNGQVNVESLKYRYLSILEDGIIGTDQFNGIKPETITSFEVGFRSLVESKRLFEAILYVNHYRNFIGVTRVIKPRTSPLTDLTLAAEQANNPGTSDQYYVSDNSRNAIITQGLELVYDVTSDEGTNFVVNTTFANIIQNTDDPLTPGFNTPSFKLNLTLGHDRISKNFGGKVSWRYRSAYDWESNFVDGRIPGYNTFDFQMTYRIPKIYGAIRFGGNNVLNNAQFNAFGGPEITAFYYLSFGFDPF